MIGNCMYVGIVLMKCVSHPLRVLTRFFGEGALCNDMMMVTRARDYKDSVEARYGSDNSPDLGQSMSFVFARWNDLPVGT